MIYNAEADARHAKQRSEHLDEFCEAYLEFIDAVQAIPNIQPGQEFSERGTTAFHSAMVAAQRLYSAQTVVRIDRRTTGEGKA